MERNRYVIFDDDSSAKLFLQKLSQQLGGEVWAIHEGHPFDGRAAVPWNDEYLRKHENLLVGRKVMLPTEVLAEGWTFGYYRGPFAKARTKLEDAMFARDALDLFEKYPNFPAYRAVFYGILVALYGVKEALRHSCSKLGSMQKQWWEKKFQEIESDPLLKRYYELHNADKHSLEDAGLTPTTKVFSYRGDIPEIFSGEGVFSVIGKGTADERRVFHTGADAMFDCYFQEDGPQMSVKVQVDYVIEHYKRLVWEARQNFEKRPSQ